MSAAPLPVPVGKRAFQAGHLALQIRHPPFHLRDPALRVPGSVPQVVELARPVHRPALEAGRLAAEMLGPGLEVRGVLSFVPPMVAHQFVPLVRAAGHPVAPLAPRLRATSRNSSSNGAAVTEIDRG